MPGREVDMKHFNVENLLRLPACIEKDGREYTLEIFSEGSRELRICYTGDPREEVEDQPNFLYLIRGIETNEHLADAISRIRSRLELDGYSALINETIEYRNKRLQEGLDKI